MAGKRSAERHDERVVVKIESSEGKVGFALAAGSRGWIESALHYTHTWLSANAIPQISNVFLPHTNPSVHEKKI